MTKRNQPCTCGSGKRLKKCCGTGRSETTLTDTTLMNQDLLHQALDNHEAYYNLGNAFMDQGRLNDAASNFLQAISLKPDYVEAFINLGVVFKDQGKLDEAVSSFNKAIAFKPSFAMTHYNLGNVLKQQGKLDDAIASFRRAISVEPNYYEAHYNLGVVLQAQGKLEDAVESYHKALSLQPGLAEAYNNSAMIFNELGEMDKAVTYFKKALSLKPTYAEAYKNLSLIVRHTENNDDIREMEDIFNNIQDIPDKDRSTLGFALGKAFEDLGDYSKAFTYILQANSLKRGLYKYSIQNDRDFFERIRKTFTSDFFSLNHGSGIRDRVPIFILGMPRSGTTLVEQILASHQLVFGAGELEILAELITVFCRDEKAIKFPECVVNLDKTSFGRMGSEYIAKIKKYSNHAEFITDKMPYNFLYIGLIKTILPNAKIIHCVRDPMDNCYSIFKTGFTRDNSYAYDMTELGQYYNLYRNLMAHWEKVLPGFMYTIRYEEVVANQRRQTENLLHFCELSWDDACLSFYNTERRVSTASLAQVRQPIYNDSVELWKRYENQLEPLRKEIYS